MQAAHLKEKINRMFNGERVSMIVIKLAKILFFPLFIGQRLVLE